MRQNQISKNSNRGNNQRYQTMEYEIQNTKDNESGQHFLYNPFLNTVFLISYTFPSEHRFLMFTMFILIAFLFLILILFVDMSVDKERTNGTNQHISKRFRNP
jgi:hypothetical protein